MSAVVFSMLRDEQNIEAIDVMLQSLEAASSNTTTFTQLPETRTIREVVRQAIQVCSNDESSFGNTHERDFDETNTDQPESPLPLIGHQDQCEQVTVNLSTFLDCQQDGRDSILGTYAHEVESTHWTDVTSNSALIDHILALYFCWEYPTFASFSKEHFIQDFRVGITKYCSSLLVNAILAVGCRFSNHPEARQDANDSSTTGNHFFAEAMRLLELENNKHALTTIQALGLLSLREASCGRSNESIFFSNQSIRLAIEIGLHKEPNEISDEEDQIHDEVRSVTFWGAFNLDQ